jgi:hypothetical protein
MMMPATHDVALDETLVDRSSLAVNIETTVLRPMLGDADEDFGDGTGSAVLSLVFGLLVQLFFNALTQAQDAGVFLVVLAGFSACILFGAIRLAVPSGVAFGFGMMLTSFVAQDWWLVGLAVAAVMTNLTKHALSDPDVIGIEDIESPTYPADPS